MRFPCNSPIQPEQFRATCAPILAVSEPLPHLRKELRLSQDLALIPFRSKRPLIFFSVDFLILDISYKH